MLMETLISRGGAPVRYRINGFEYVFRRNDDGHFVCPVLSGGHRKLLESTGNFRVYAPKEVAPEPKDVPMIATRPEDFVPRTDDDDLGAQTVTDTDAEPKRRGGRKRK